MKDKIFYYSYKNDKYHDRPQIKWEYPLNLSILISGGKETNKDFLSNGEWRGKSSNLKSITWESNRIVVFWICILGTEDIKIPWKGVSKKVIILWMVWFWNQIYVYLRVGLFGNAILNGWYISSKAKYS